MADAATKDVADPKAEPSAGSQPTGGVPAGGGPPDAGSSSYPDWRRSLPEEIRSDKSLDKIAASSEREALAAIAKSFVNVQPLLGADKLVVPGKEADDATKRTFWTKLGCPETPDGYAVPENLPDGVTIDEAGAKAFFAEAHKVGLSRQHAAWALRQHADREVKRAAELSQRRSADAERAMDELRVEWGEAFPERLAMARDAVAKMGGAELASYMDESGMGNDPRMVKAFAKVGKMLAEDQVHGRGSVSFAMSPQEASRAWDEIQMDPNFMKALLDDRNPGHAAAVDRKSRLFQAMYPEPKK